MDPHADISTAEIWTGVEARRWTRPSFGFGSSRASSALSNRFERWCFTGLEDGPRDMIVLSMMMGLVALLVTVATIATSATGESYVSQLDQQHAEWVAEQPAPAP